MITNFFRKSYKAFGPTLRQAENAVANTQSDVVEFPEKKEIPVHLRRYDPSKYEGVSGKLKSASGYALLDLEPFPRAKIMKLGYIILDKVKECPEEAMYRMYTEEKVKHIMKLTDEITDIRTLEEALGFDSIEAFIQSFRKEIKLVDHMLASKPWVKPDENDPDFQIAEVLKQKRIPTKHNKHLRDEREKVSFLDAKSQ